MVDVHASFSASDEDDDFVQEESDNPSMKGVLSKWTNYIHGWQDRFVSCKDGTLCYYRTQDETEFGCRGSISLVKASISSHEFDTCRFDITINDSTWYLRAASETEKQEWVDVIEANKLDADNISLRRHGSLMSLGSGPSITSSSSFRKGQGLKEKLAELETFRDILDRQVQNLQKYFDSCANQIQPKDPRNHWTGENEIDEEENHEQMTSFHAVTPEKPLGVSGMDFRGEAITFKATTSGVLTTLSHCIELINKREEVWGRRLEKEQERRKKAEEHFNLSLAAVKKNGFVGSPDYEEGPQSGLTEEEFFDAVEAELDRQERVTQDIEHSKYLIREAEKQPKGHHRFTEELDKRINNHLSDSLSLDMSDRAWELFAEEGEMKVYRRELVEDGLICDPLKAVHSIKRVTAREMCHYFWETDVRLEWEGTIESFRVLEILDQGTIVIYQTHKRIWPSAQRDCLYVSSMQKVDNPPVSGDGRIPHDTWMVCNFSADHDEANPVSGCIRALVEICLICQTFVTPYKDGRPLDRDCLHCEIVYVANVNPGGWAPASVLRSIYKREYPKFLRRFTAYVQNKTREKEIWF